MGFRLIPTSMTSTELKLIKCTFQRCIGYIDIAGRFRAMGRQTSAGGENKPFYGFKRQYLENGRRYVQSY